MKTTYPPSSREACDEGSPVRLVMAIIIVGVLSGLLGMLLAMLLHEVQHVAFGYSLHEIISDESFLQGVQDSTYFRRVVSLMFCGLIAGLGWWTLYHYGKPLVSITEALKTNKVMPMGETLTHVLLQIITIALGSPLGREVAPREISALFAYQFATKLNLSPQQTKILLACGAGAGLAAVYNVPFGGALFALEVLLRTFHWSTAVIALTTSAIAVVISWVGLGNEPLYHIPNLFINTQLVLWAIFIGPIFGLSANWFIKVIMSARNNPIRDWRMIPAALINFTIIGFLAIYSPALLGNGKSPAQIEFYDALTISASFILLLLRTLICWSSFKVGAQGGLLTPSLANGALLGVCLGGLYSMLFPGVSLSAYAVIGAAAFLAAAQKMPITAIVLIFEFTHLNLSFLVPIMFAVAGSIGIIYLCEKP